MKTNLFKTIAFLSLISAPVLLTSDKIYTEFSNYNSPKNRPEDFANSYYERVDRDALSWDMFGDWVIPERKVEIFYWGTEMWNGSGIGGGETLDHDLHANFMVDEAWNYLYEENSEWNSTQERTTWHEEYNNMFQASPDTPAITFNEETNEWEEINYDYGHGNLSAEDIKVVSRTPMRGIVPFWEWTNNFNTYLLEQTSNGTVESDSLFFEEYYMDYISNYVKETKSKFPSIYHYLENPSLLDELFLSDDSVEWILPEDWTMTEQSDLTNAIVGFDSTWNVFAFTLYLEDYIIWNWNNNVYPNKDKELAYYDDLVGDLSPDTINILWNTGRTASDINEWTLSSEMIALDPSDPRLDYTFEESDINTLFLTNDSRVLERTQHMGYVTEDALDSNGQYGQYGTPKYKWSYSSGSWYDMTYGDYYELYNPLKEQMNIDYEATTLDFSNIATNFDKDLKPDLRHDLRLESEFIKFREPFEEWLINSELGINQEFIEFYSTNTNTYYSNMSEDGTAFLGRNRLQSGIYPVEDIRMSDLIITYEDQEGNTLNDTTLLGDIESVNVTIEFNEDSETAALFDTSILSPAKIVFDTTDLRTDIVVHPDNNDGAPIALILISIIAVVGIAGGVTAGVLSKKK